MAAKFDLKKVVFVALVAFAVNYFLLDSCFEFVSLYTSDRFYPSPTLR